MVRQAGMQPKRIVFIDIDGTLLDANYAVNSSTLESTIRSMQEGGTVFALNSNRSLADMVPIAERFCIDGPIIVENGIFYATRHSDTRHMLVADAQAESLRHSKIIFERRLIKELKQKFGDTFRWLSVDTVDMLSHAKNIHNFPLGTLVVINNQFREYTTSAHILRQTHDGLIHAETDIIDGLCDSMQQWADEHDFVVVRGYEFANVLACTKRTSKRAAAIALHDKYPGTLFAAIGNEDGDAKMIEGIGGFYAVSNAMDSAKRNASFVATASTTQGVEEILQHICDATVY